MMPGLQDGFVLGFVAGALTVAVPVSMALRSSAARAANKQRATELETLKRVESLITTGITGKDEAQL